MRFFLNAIIIYILLVSGCSSESTLAQSNNLFAGENEVNVTKKNDSPLGTLSKSLEETKLKLNLEKGSQVGKNIQFFIDSDYNRSTGYINQWIDGADYLIENETIFKSTSNGTSWNWQIIGLASFENNDTNVYIEILEDTIENLQPNFRVAVSSASSDWEVISSIRMNPIYGGIVTINANSLEWTDIPLLANSELGNLKITYDFERVYFLLQLNDDTYHSQIYIDSDKNVNTGYKGDAFKNSGAEYLIEDNRLYQFTNDKKWPNEHIGFVDFAKNGDIIELSIAKNKIGIKPNNNSFFVGAMGWNDDFDTQTGKIPMKDTLLTNETNESENAKMQIFIIGDSTVHNTTISNGNRIGMGWGDKLGQYMTVPQNLYNLAQPGASSKSYKDRSDLEYDGWFHNWHQTKKIIDDTNITYGGYLFIQFGHNDETTGSDIGTLPGIDNSFYNELKEYVQYAREVYLTPVLITPVERMNKVAGSDTEKSHIKAVGDYAQTVRDLSQIENVILLDLQHKSWSSFNNYENSTELIKTFGYGDNTHFSPKGAEIIASWVKELICDGDDQTLCLQFK